MSTLRFAVAVAFLLHATVWAVELVDLDFNITIPANSSNVVFSEGWTQVGDELQFNEDDRRNKSVEPMQIWTAAVGICVHGQFDLMGGMDHWHEGYLVDSYIQTATDEQTSLCSDPSDDGYSNIAYTIGDGVASVTNITLKSRMKAPAGSTSEDIAVTNEPFVTAKGKLSSGVSLEFTSGNQSVEQDELIIGGGMIVTIPDNTTYFVIRGRMGERRRGRTMVCTMFPSWPEPYELPNEATYEFVPQRTYGQRDTPLFFSGSLDPTVRYSVGVGSGEVFLSSIDIYTVEKKPQPTSSMPQPTQSAAESTPAQSKSIVGPAVGGVIGGVSLLLLLAFGIWYLRRRRERTRYGKEGDKFQVDPDNQVTTPFAAYSSPLRAEEMYDASGKSLHPGGTTDSATAATAVRNLIRESDGGGLIQGEDEFLPPLYNPSWSEPSDSSGPSTSGYNSTQLSSAIESESVSTATTYPQEKRGLHSIPQ